MPYRHIILRVPDTPDFPAMAGILYQCWNEAYRGIVNDTYLDGLSMDGLLERLLQNRVSCRFLAAEIDGDIAGFCRYSLPQEGKEGAVSELYVSTKFRRRGVGRALLNAAAEDFRQLGLQSMILGCFEDNHSARTFYEKAGGDAVYVQNILIGGQPYSAVFYRFSTGSQAVL